jgi:hypothetical protein
MVKASYNSTTFTSLLLRSDLVVQRPAIQGNTDTDRVLCRGQHDQPRGDPHRLAARADAVSDGRDGAVERRAQSRQPTISEQAGGWHKDTERQASLQPATTKLN